MLATNEISVSVQEAQIVQGQPQLGQKLPGARREAEKLEKTAQKDVRSWYMGSWTTVLR